MNVFCLSNNFRPSDLFYSHDYFCFNPSGGFSFLIKNLGEGHCLVRVNTSQKYLLLPVEDASPMYVSA